MTSTMLVYGEGREKPFAAFKLPVKWVFGRRFCDTDGSIGYPTTCEPTELLEAVAECATLKLDAREQRDLARIERLARLGKSVLIDWQH